MKYTLSARILLLTGIILFTAASALPAQGVSVNETGQPPHPGAMLDVSSTSKGVLIPRTDTASVTNPAEGMIIYDTESMCLRYYNGAHWVALQQAGANQFWWADADGDGYGDPFNVIYAPMAPPFFVANSDDCDDTNSGVFPVAPEVCDGIDNDCDGLVDGDDPDVNGVVYVDADGDGWGDLSMSMPGCAPAPPGYSHLAGDCDDGNPNVNPGMPEICDGIDNNCDGAVDEDDPGLIEIIYQDLDGDGFGNPGVSIPGCPPAPAGYSLNGDDCDDSSSDVYPGAPEICDGLDNNCNGEVDEPTGGTCLIMGVCYEAGQLNPMNACEVCDPVQNGTGWTAVSCQVGETCCDGVCLQLDTDPNNCGDCGVVCNDGLTCTQDVCAGGVCMTVIDPDKCVINGVCYELGEANPMAECQVCDPNISQTGWTNLPAGTTCSTGLCNGNGDCVECLSAGDCPDDGLPCTIEACAGETCVTILDPATCFIDGVCYNDGDPNPGAECLVCNAAANQTGWTPLPAGTGCSGGECDGAGNCQ